MFNPSRIKKSAADQRLSGRFCKAHELKYRQDEDLNVIIWKDGSKGYEASEPVILQGHMDMVAVKEADCDKDMEKKDWIWKSMEIIFQQKELL